MKAKTKSNKPSASDRSKSYAKAIRNAYDYGFRDGYAAHDHISNTRGARTAAQYGYGRGLSAHKKVNKYQAKARR